MGRSHVNCGVVPIDLSLEVSSIVNNNNLIDCVEYRLDYMDPQHALQRLREFLSVIKKPGICTVRSRDEGGVVEWPLDLKMAALTECANRGLLVDLEYDIVSRLGAPVRNSFIVSIHDFSGRISPGEIPTYLDAMSRLSPLVKLAKLVESIDDAVAMLDAVRRFRRIKLTLLPMGDTPIVKILRLLLANLGSFIDYISLGKPTARGQLSLDELREVVKMGLVRI